STAWPGASRPLGKNREPHVDTRGEATSERVRDLLIAIINDDVCDRTNHRSRCKESFMASENGKGRTEVVVIGGGPAGSRVSTLIAQRGKYGVQLLEREGFPRFHIGESLIPETYWVLKRLRMLDKMKQSHFVKKFSVQFVNADGK